MMNKTRKDHARCTELMNYLIEQGLCINIKILTWHKEAVTCKFYPATQ